MKQRTALKQSVVSVKFLSCAVVVMIALAVKYPGVYTLVPLVIFALYLALEAYNIHRIRKRAAEDPSFLDQKLK
jgi:hypothetical protein